MRPFSIHHPFTVDKIPVPEAPNSVSATLRVIAGTDLTGQVSLTKQGQYYTVVPAAGPDKWIVPFDSVIAVAVAK